MKLKNFLLLVVGGGALLCGGSFAGLTVLGINLGAVFTSTDAPTPRPGQQAQQNKAPQAAVRTVKPSPEPAPTGQAQVAPKPGGVLRASDEAVMRYGGQDLGTSKKKDVSKGKPYKINVYQDDGNATANRAKVDLDRDDKWDEKWTFDGDSIQRKVAPADDENYTEVTLWTGTEWVAE
jgi:hypothetical protein